MKNISSYKNGKIWLILFILILLSFSFLRSYKSNRSRSEIINYFKSTIVNISKIDISFNIKGNRKTYTINDKEFFTEIEHMINVVTRDSRNKGMYDTNGNIVLFVDDIEVGYISFYLDFGNDTVWLILSKERQKQHVTYKFIDSNSFWENLVKNVYDLP